MQRGLQVGFGELIGPDLLRALAALGFTLIRCDMQPVLEPRHFRILLDEVLAAGLNPMPIIRPEQSTWLPSTPALDIEVLNEPDLTGWAWRDYAANVNAVCTAVDGRHRVWAGSLSNLTPSRLGWLQRVIGSIPVSVGITVHRYPKNGADDAAPQEGFKSRDAEIEWLKTIIEGRRWGCSEFGYHTGPQRRGHLWWTERWHWTDAQVAAFTQRDLRRWEAWGAEFAVYYQVNDGSGGGPIDRYGVRRLDGTWKPVAKVFGTVEDR